MGPRCRSRRRPPTKSRAIRTSRRQLPQPDRAPTPLGATERMVPPPSVGPMSGRFGRLFGAVAVVSVLGFAAAGPAGAAASGYYLDLGASVSLGVQPSPVTGHGTPTDTGYSNDLVAEQAARGDELHL